MDDFGHHRQSDALTRRAVSPYAALEDLLRFGRIDTRAIIFHFDTQSLEMATHRHLHFADGKFAGIVEQVTHQLHQVALFAVEESVIVELEVGLQLLVAIDLGQAGQQFFNQRYRLGTLAGKALAAGHGPSELILDHLIHGEDLLVDVVVDLPPQLHFAGGDLDQRQPGFKAVGEIVEGVLVALGLLAFVFQQLVDGVGQRG